MTTKGIHYVSGRSRTCDLPRVTLNFDMFDVKTTVGVKTGPRCYI